MQYKIENKNGLYINDIKRDNGYFFGKFKADYVAGKIKISATGVNFVRSILYNKTNITSKFIHNKD